MNKDKIKVFNFKNALNNSPHHIWVEKICFICIIILFVMCFSAEDETIDLTEDVTNDNSENKVIYFYYFFTIIRIGLML